MRFSSAILPAWSRKSPQVAEVLPLLYLHGLSSSDFGPALEQFLGSDAGLSAATITRLTAQWQDEARAFNARSLADTDYVYVWVDGIHLKVRLEADKVCLLVIIGVRADGRKELVAPGRRVPGVDRVVGRPAAGLQAARHAGSGAGGRRRRARVLEGASVTCSPRPPSNGAGGTRSATSSPRCRSRCIRRRSEALAEIYNAEDKTHARAAAKAFAAEFGAKWPKATAKITDDLDVLLAFYDYPAEHWIHLRTTQPDRVDLRHRPAPPAGHQGPRLPGRRRRDGVQADRVSPAPLAHASTHPTSSPLVRAGATFVNGKLVERPDDQDQQGGDQQAA